MKASHTPRSLQLTVLLRSDGNAVACGSNDSGQCDVLPLDQGMMYSQVSAGKLHTVLLRSDGCALANGKNMHGQCDIPQLHEGMLYSQIAAGGLHTVLIQSGGCAMLCCGFRNEYSRTMQHSTLGCIGVSYIQVSAGWKHTVLLRSDGIAVACGLAAATYTRNATCRLWSLELATPEIRFRILGTSF